MRGGWGGGGVTVAAGEIHMKPRGGGPQGLREEAGPPSSPPVGATGGASSGLHSKLFRLFRLNNPERAPGQGRGKVLSGTKKSKKRDTFFSGRGPRRTVEWFQWISTTKIGQNTKIQKLETGSFWHQYIFYSNGFHNYKSCH